jgi:hypothetical protein
MHDASYRRYLYLGLAEIFLNQITNGLFRVLLAIHDSYCNVIS